MTVENITLGKHAVIRFPELCNIYDCEIGDYSFIGPFVEIQRGVTIGQFAKIESHTFICEGVTIGDRCFIGHSVTFCNDLFPAIDAAPVRLFQTIVEDDAVIGSGATILPVRIGNGAVIGAGAVVVDPVPNWSVVVGNPGRIVAGFTNLKDRNEYFAARQRNYLLAIPRQRGGHS
jgi:UDP-2-acetamido-3-amino-2,3-dideoxy-glucuronate N-acetyltransferase